MSEQEKIQYFKEYDLPHFKNRRLDQKVEQIIEFIQKTLAPFSKISLSFSGGKDSQLCLSFNSATVRLTHIGRNRGCV